MTPIPPRPRRSRKAIQSLVERVITSPVNSGAKSDAKSHSRIDGHIDFFGWDQVSGWVCAPVEPDRIVVLDVFLDAILLLSIEAETYRGDLVVAGKGHGRHGFSFAIPRGISAAPVAVIALRDRVTGLDVPGSPFKLTNDQAGLGVEAKAFLGTRIKALDDGVTLDLLDEHAVFLLEQLDTVMQVRARAVDREAQGWQNWQRVFSNSAPGSILSGLVDVALHQYGGRILHVPTAAAPDVSIIIPVHGKFWYTYQCLTRIAEHTPALPFEVILVDDRSTDETLLASMLLSGVRIMRNEHNLGFVGSVNAGAAVARGRHLLLLNNDTEVRPGWMDELSATLDRDPGIGVVGAKLLFPSGALQECGGIIWRLGDGWNYGRDQDPDRPEFCFLRDADYVSGAALMIRRDVWERLGGLSEAFAPAYYEDTDLCFRVRAAGYRVVVQPASRVVHHEGISAGTDVAGSGMKRHQRSNRAVFAARWADTLAGHAVSGTASPASEADRAVTKRALFIDNSVPTPDRDAGSVVAFEHMRALMRLGYHVHFVPSDNMARIDPYTGALERIGIRCHFAPYQRSAEEVLRDHEGQFDVIYIHRVENARHIPAARARNPTARIIYNVADLHHLRMLRQSEWTPEPGLVRRAHQVRSDELSAVMAADMTITHSTAEAALLATEVPSATVLVMPWVVRPAPVKRAFADRSGIAFIGSMHPPNLDAASWLLREIMPLVWQKLPSLALHLVGGHAADPTIAALAQATGHRRGRVILQTWVPDLGIAMADCRLTIAPLRFGAGLKGKLLDSLSLGLPCIATGCAIEGAELPPSLLDLVAETPRTLAALIVRAHEDATLNAAAAAAGLAYIEATCTENRIDALLETALSNQDETEGGSDRVVSLRPTSPLRLPIAGASAGSAGGI